MLLSAAAASAALAVPKVPAAQVGQSLLGNPGHYRLQVGDVRATVLSDGTLSGSPRVYASDAPEAELRDLLAQAHLPADAMTLNLNTLLLESGGRKILVEAGAAQTMGPNGGRLFANLAAVGVRPEDIDVVAVSHTHPDHVGNLCKPGGTPAFPKAAVHVPEADWDFFIRNEPDLGRLPLSEEFRRRFVANIRRSLEPVASGVVLFRPGQEIAPGLTALPAEGHTPGMVNFLVHSGGDQLLLTADLAYHPLVNVDRPWRPGPDLDPDAALRSRRRAFDRASSEGLLVLGFHFPFPGLGRVRRTGGGYAWVPANWSF